MNREYPAGPIPSVGAIVCHGDRVLLVLRAQEPSRGKWSVPGGVVELGETVGEAARREVLEECGLEIEVGEAIAVRDAIIRDQDGRIRFHYVLVDMVARCVGGELSPASDAADARWFSRAELDDLDLTTGLLPVLLRGFDECSHLDLSPRRD
jgi:8-oxo-dGTP diphosphatase